MPTRYLRYGGVGEFDWEILMDNFVFGLETLKTPPPDFNFLVENLHFGLEHFKTTLPSLHRIGLLMESFN